MSFKGWKHTEETKRKIADANRRRVWTEETKRKMSDLMKGEKSPNFGKHFNFTEEHRRKLSEARRGRKPMLGKKHSEETKRKMSEARRGRKPMLGKKHSEAARKKMSESRRRNKEELKRFAERSRKKSSTWRYKRSQWMKKNNVSKRPDVKAKISMALSGKGNPNWGGRYSSSQEYRDKMAKSLTGNKNPNWRGGSSFIPYCYKFNEELKERIRDRDNRTCQLCGEHEGGERLRAHHIHYDKPNCEPDLIALCNRCSGKVNFNREYWEMFFMNLLHERFGLIRHIGMEGDVLG